MIGKSLTVACALIAMGGCAAAPDLIGLGAGGVAGAATANPAVALAVGLGVRAATREVMDYAARARTTTRQQALADAAGAAGIGETVHWQAVHIANLGNLAGEATILREIATPLATCREVALTVEDNPLPYVTTICPHGEGWAWGSAEPAIARWGSLQ